MPTLALAGGTSSSLGRAIVTAILSNPKQSFRWKTVILSRTPRIPPWLQAVDPDGRYTEIRTVNYLSTESLTVSLTDVHTLVSITSAIDGTQAQVQTNLLKAAVQAGCRRFAPSQWGFGPKGWEQVGSLRRAADGVWEECKKSRDIIECARFNHGSFMNYLGHGIYYPVSARADKDTQLLELKAGGGYMAGEDEAVEGLARQGDLQDGSGGFLVGLKTGTAELPIKDDGTWPRITLTSMRDVGRLVAASLDLPRWEESMTMAGDTLTMGELLVHAEAVTGKKFQVEVLKKEHLEEKLAKMAPHDFMAVFWTEAKLAYTRDLDDEVVLDPVVNRLCPEVKPVTTQEYLERFWGKHFQ